MEYGIKWRFVIPPILTNVSALPGETRSPEIVSFSHAEYRASKTKWLHYKYLHIVLNNTTLLPTNNYWNSLMSVEDTASHSSVVLRHGIQHNWKDTISGVHVHVSPGSAETLVMRGRITNHRLIAYSISNISGKNYQNRLMYIEVIVRNHSVVFLRRSSVKCWSYVWSFTRWTSTAFNVYISSVLNNVSISNAN